jgi:peptide/nickel transport system substrate-binding protein
MTLGILRVLAFAVALAAVPPAVAQELRIGIAQEPSSIDPHFNLVGPDESLARQLFDTLILQDERQRPTPGLAVSWHAVDERTWEFHLRPGVVFSDGSAFTAEDVAFTLKRAPNVEGSPGGYGIFTRQVKRVEIVDPLTIRLGTDNAYPLMPNDLSVVPIISHSVGEKVASAEFNSGKAAIGTGPFRFVEWVPGDRIVMTRNDAYWGPKPPWQRVVLKPIPNDSARVAALLSGDVDLIDFVPPSVREDLQGRADIRVVQAVSNRVIYMHLDSYRERSPFVTDLQGAVLEQNPLRDPRVRAAISKAIDRRAIVDYIMGGLGEPAGQLLPPGYFGTSAKLPPEPLDREGAKQLLAEAGYPNGFGITLHTSTTRPVNSEKTAVAIAEMLGRVGIATKVVGAPEAIFKTGAAKFDYSLFMLGWGSETGEASSSLRGILATRDPAKGLGSVNRGRYSNPELDRLLGQAMETIDDGARDSLLQRAMEAGMADHGAIPLYFEVAAWASRKDLAYTPRGDEYTLAQSVTRAP